MKPKPTIKITVSGPQGSGKTQCIAYLDRCLSSRNFNPPGIGRPEFEFEEIQTPGIPAAVPVPLGPNRTRDGREARVICNDREGDQPVIALVKEKGIEYQKTFTLDGHYYASGEDYVTDLVGHIPEPRKPREWTLRVAKETNRLYPCGEVIGAQAVTSRPATLADHWEEVAVQEIIKP